MDDNIKQILTKIDELRTLLQINIEQKGLNDSEVESLSKRLDIVLNEYYKAIIKKS